MRELFVQISYYFNQIWATPILKVPACMLSTSLALYSQHLNGNAFPIKIFFIFVAANLILGTGVAFKFRCFEIRLFGRWVLKVGTHIGVILVVGLTARSVLEPLGFNWPLLDCFMGALICTEALSILKNMQKLNLPVPRLAVTFINDLQRYSDQKKRQFFNDPKFDRRRKEGRSDDEC